MYNFVMDDKLLPFNSPTHLNLSGEGLAKHVQEPAARVGKPSLYICIPIRTPNFNSDIVAGTPDKKLEVFVRLYHYPESLTAKLQ